MKKITSTITTTTVTARFYDHESDTLLTEKLTVSGKPEALQKRHGENNRFELLKVLETEEPKTATYSMDIETFMALAEKSDTYKYGFINRKIGGDVMVVKAYNLETDETEIIESEIMTEKQFNKANPEYKVLKILETKKVDEINYYMSETEFARLGEIIER